MFMTALAAFMVLLCRYSGQDDIVVGTPVADRNRAETEGLIGFFVNTLVMRVDLSGDPSFGEVLRRVRTMVLAAYSHQDLPFEQLVDELVTVRDRSRTPLFQVLFGYDAADTAGPDADFDWGADIGRPAGDGLDDSLTVKCDLEFLLTERDSGLAGSFEYSSALFDAATIGRMTGHLSVLLAAIVADAGQRVGDLPVLTAGERELLVAGWNDTAVPVPAAGGIHELITGRAGACPDAVAVLSGDGCLTYAGADRAGGAAGGVLAGAGGGAGVGGRVVPGPGAGHGDRDAGDLAGRGGVPAAGPGLPGGAAGVHAGR